MSEKVNAKLARIKVADNLFRRGESYIFRLGDFEEVLGKFKDDAAAIEYLKLYRQMRDAVGAKAYQFKVGQLFPEYLKEREKEVRGVPGRRMISQRTYDEIEEKWRVHLKKAFAKKYLSEITAPLWNTYCEKSKVGDLRNHRKVFRTFLEWCVQNDYLRVIPNFKIPMVKKKRRQILTPDQLKALFSHSRGTMLLFNAFYLLQGMRWGEIISLRWDAIDFQKMTIAIHDETSRTRRGRGIKLNPYILKLLTDRLGELKEQRIKTPYVFPKLGAPDEPMHYQTPMNAWVRTLKRAGLSDLKLRPHDLRATAEWFAHKRTDFTGTQLEKHFGSSLEIQRGLYVDFGAEDLHGLESVVSFEGSETVFDSTRMHALTRRKGGEKTGPKKNKRRVDNEND